MEAIKVEDLTKRFEDVTAVDQVSFSVQQGELFGLLGPNGAGKTTTINMLSTLLKPTSGRAEVAGFDVAKDRDNVRKSIGIVFQEPALDGKLTGRENLEFHAMMYGIKKAERNRRIDAVLKLVDLTDKAAVLVEKYSGGMKRRLEIARGRIAGGTTTALIQGLLVLAVSFILGFRVSSVPNLLLALVFMVLIAFTFIGFGLIFASKMKDMQGFGLIINFIIFPLFFLSGALYPVNNLPVFVRVLSYIDPLTYGIDGLRGAMINVAAHSLALNLLVMSAFALVMLFLGAYFFEKSENV